MLYTHFCSSHLSVGWLSIGEHFPQRDSIAPHITRMGKCAIVDGLRSIPAAGEQRFKLGILVSSLHSCKMFLPSDTAMASILFAAGFCAAILFKGGYNLEGSVCFCGKFFGKPIAMGVQTIQ